MSEVWRVLPRTSDPTTASEPNVYSGSMFGKLLALALTLGLAVASSGVVIWNVTVVDPAEGRHHPGMVVETSGDRIKAVRPAPDEPPSTDRQLVDGTGKYLVPGLWDSHVHLTKLGPSALGLFVAHGVTSVRDMGSDLSEVLQWRAEIEAGIRVGPRIKTSGQILESDANVSRMLREGTVEPVGRIRKPVAGPGDGRRSVEELVDAGADFIKARTVPDRETFLALAKACRDQGVQLVGHPVAEPELLGKAGMASVEHALSLSPSPSESDRNRIHGVIKQAGVFVGTTVSNFERSLLVPYEEGMALLETDPRMKFVESYLRRDWQEQLEERRPLEALEMMAALRRLVPRLNNELRELHETGVPLLPGSDAAVFLTYPGWGLHDELASLVANVGLTPADALRSATTAPAVFFGLEDELGAIQPDRLADFVMLAGDPLENIENTGQIVGVAVRGRWFGRATLDELLRTAALEAQATYAAKPVR